MGKPRTYTDNQFIDAVETSTSIRQVLAKLGLKEAGGNYKVAQQRIEKLGISLADGPNGQGWSKGKTLGPKKPIEYYLTENSYHQSHKLKLRLIQEGIKTHKCECCGITDWNNKPTPIELDHINGINTDNRLENLRLLCPNCHAQTETYRGKNKII
jgi:Zn finger protein HypA/HybF involved in hydrogenase expression